MVYVKWFFVIVFGLVGFANVWVVVATPGLSFSEALAKWSLGLVLLAVAFLIARK